MLKPSSLLARDREWAQLDAFLHHPDPQLRIGVVSGRRRVGKSFLLRAACQAVGGLYVSAVAEEGPAAARRRFASAIGTYAGVSPGLVAAEDSDWQDLLTAALELVTRNDPNGLLVIDELPYWMAHSPEIPGLLQLLYDRSQNGQGPGGRVLLCGSAMSVIVHLLSGTKALRGRAALDIRLGPFDYREAAAYWGIDDPLTALHLHSVLGGAPGYRNLSNAATPRNITEFSTWVIETLLDPGQALFSRSETDYLLREDPKFTGSALHYAVISAVAAGATSPAKIGSLVERDRTALHRTLDALSEARYLRRETDLLWERRPTITLADPIVRFHNLVTVAQNDLIELGRSAQAWSVSQHTYESRILGPHFEDLARDWARRYATDEALNGVFPGRIGTTAVPDRSGKAKHEVDVLGVDPSYQPTSKSARITFIGEAKVTAVKRGLSDLARLERIQEALTEHGHRPQEAKLALFSLHGFYEDLIQAAKARKDVLLVDLPMLYGRHTDDTKAG